MQPKRVLQLKIMDKSRKIKPRQKSAAREKRRIKKIVIIVVSLALLWIFFAPGLGVVSYMSKRAEFNRVQNESDRLRQANQELQAEIDRLLTDSAYLESLAREKYDMLKPNEKVYDFSKKKNKEKE